MGGQMNMMTIWKSVSFAAVGMALLGCEGNTDYLFELDNQTQDTLHVVHALGKYSPELDPEALDVLPMSIVTLGTTSWRGGRSEEVDEVSLRSEFGQTLHIERMNGDTLLKNWRSPDNWDIEVEELNRFPANWIHTCRFSVTDADF